jgi:hypothetical protein
MKTFIYVTASAVLLAAGCATQIGRPVPSGPSNIAVPAGASENGLRGAIAPQDPYDQPGGLPANSGGTDAGRVGTDPRYEPVR